MASTPRSTNTGTPTNTGTNPGSNPGSNPGTNTGSARRGTHQRVTAGPGGSAQGAGDHTWVPQPLAAAIISDLLADLLTRLPAVAALATRLLVEGGTRLVDLIDAIVVRGTPGLSDRLRRAGFTLQPRRGADICFSHAGGSFPDLILVPEPMLSICIAVESVADFAAAHAIDSAIEGEPGAPYRRLQAYTGDNCALWVVERHGYDGFQVTDLQPRYVLDCQRVWERFRCRRRLFSSDLDGFDHAESLITQATLAVGRDMACDLFFSAEREYWQRRNRAGQVQKQRQDLLGLGWANHDHHTYRSSRGCFQRLIQLLELLGLQCRERFYPGVDAGWGAQILEHPVTGIVVFADVDMSPQEVGQDFAHLGLPPGGPLGTVGLWCALHGEAFLEAGMHHLEALFSFSELSAQLGERGIEMMPPFSDFPHLRQAFSVGERWSVRRERIMRLLANDLIDAHQARTFLDQGVLGSHLENLERNDGFKGFNQRGVDHIISSTDPRRESTRTPPA